MVRSTNKIKGIYSWNKFSTLKQTLCKAEKSKFLKSKNLNLDTKETNYKLAVYIYLKTLLINLSKVNKLFYYYVITNFV